MIHERLKELRKTLGLSQEKIAKKLGIDQSNYSKYEKAKLSLDADMIEKLRTHFDISVHWLFTGEGPMIIKISGKANEELVQIIDRIIDLESGDPEKEKEFLVLVLNFFDKYPEHREKFLTAAKLQEEYHKKLDAIYPKPKERKGK